MPLVGVIALDGPSGTGKSSVARSLAKRLGARYLDTGAMYRAATLLALRAGLAPDDADAVPAALRKAALEIGTDPAAPRIALDGDPVDAAIRTDEVTGSVSAVSAIPAVREHLVALQRELIGAGGIVVEGRDIGTVVAPAAGLKVYLTASPEERARRRSRQDGRTSEAELAAVAASIARRDELDSGRAASPLRPADDAVHLDSTELDQSQVVDRLVELAAGRGLVGVR